MKTLEDIYLVECLSELEDSREKQGRRYSLPAIMIMSICAILCNANSFGSIARFAKAKQAWFEKYFDLPNGTPSRDTFIRVFALIKPEEFHRCFLKWTNSIRELIQNETIAIDGKTLRGSSGEGLKPMHLVQAFAVENGLVLASLKVDEKTNEIKAIPELLNMLKIKDTVITIDAMGTQKDIAEQIKNQGGDYVLALKDNHKYMAREVKMAFDQYPERINHLETENQGHGRVEHRKCSVIELQVNDFKEILFADMKEWRSLNSIVKVSSTRTNTKTGEITNQDRYFISSLKANAEVHLKHIRSHWHIENIVHHTLDVQFKEDQSQVRKRNSVENYANMRRITLNLLKQNPRKERGLGTFTKREVAGWNEKFMEELLFTN